MINTSYVKPSTQSRMIEWKCTRMQFTCNYRYLLVMIGWMLVVPSFYLFNFCCKDNLLPAAGLWVWQSQVLPKNYKKSLTPPLNPIQKNFWADCIRKQIKLKAPYDLRLKDNHDPDLMFFPRRGFVDVLYPFIQVFHSKWPHNNLQVLQMWGNGET